MLSQKLRGASANTQNSIFFKLWMSSQRQFYMQKLIFFWLVLVNNYTQRCLYILASAGLTCLQAGRPLGPAVRGFAGCLCMALHLHGCLPSHGRSWHRGRRVFFINVYGSSQENLMDRTAAVARLRQCNKECYAWKRSSSKGNTYAMSTVVYTNVYPHAQTHSVMVMNAHRQNSVPEQYFCLPCCWFPHQTSGICHPNPPPPPNLSVRL